MIRYYINMPGSKLPVYTEDGHFAMFVDRTPFITESIAKSLFSQDQRIGGLVAIYSEGDENRALAIVDKAWDKNEAGLRGHYLEVAARVVDSFMRIV